jgi:hypothetical protein
VAKTTVPNKNVYMYIARSELHTLYCMAKGKATCNNKPHAKVLPKKAAPSKNAAPKKPSALQHNSRTGRSQKWVADDLDDESLGDSSEEPSPRPQKKCC